MAIFTTNLKLIATAAVAAAAVAAGSSSLYVYLLHRRLRRSTLHVYKSCSGGKNLVAATATGKSDESQIQPICTTIPDNFLTSDQYFIVYDRAWRTVKKSDLPSDEDLKASVVLNLDESWSYDQKLLTVYLRRNMSAFARYLPQARIIKMMLRKSNPEVLPTFNPAFIQKQDFVVGDVVCGIYKVLRRENAVVEFGIEQPVPKTQEKTGQQFDGRLVIGIRPAASNEDSDSVEVYSETIMWRDNNNTENKNVVMPLERKIPKLLHEVASWWLLDSGVKYLKGLKG